MKAMLLAAAWAVAFLLPLPASAQVDPSSPVPGGATGTTVACLQAGDLNSGIFQTTFLLSSAEGWEERAHMKPDLFRYKERQRTETMVELADNGRGMAIQFDFERKRVRTTRIDQPDAWRDLYHILNASDKEGATDCVTLARASGGTAAGANQSAVPRNGGTTVQFITVKIGSMINVAPGTKLSATSGPPCPGQAGFFLCPNKFTCAPVGGVCCPGAGACSAGTFCDKFIANACIGPGDPAFCPGTGNPVTGVSLHCAPGSTCLPGNFCDP